MQYVNKRTHQIINAFYWSGKPNEIDEHQVEMDFKLTDIAYFKNYTKAMRNHWIVHVEATDYRYQVMQDAEFKAEYKLHSIK